MSVSNIGRPTKVDSRDPIEVALVYFSGLVSQLSIQVYLDWVVFCALNFEFVPDAISHIILADCKDRARIDPDL